MLIGLGVAAVLFLVWFFWVTRHGGEADGRGAYNRLQRGWRRIAFWAGDVCVMGSFPWVTWDKHGHRITEEEWMDAVALMRPGDVILTTHEGYIFSNSAIPGCFKHAGFIAAGPVRGDPELIDIRPARLIEAVSAGVKKWHPARARADRAIILRPKNVTQADIDRAVAVAERIVGCDYDAGFKFNIEAELKELKRISQIDAERAAKDEKELKTAQTNVCAEFDMAFSCTETVATAWWHKRHDLQLYRNPSRGRNVIIADQFVNYGFEVVWTNVTGDQAKALRMPEQGEELIREFHNRKGV